MWSAADIADAIEAGLRARVDADDRAQAVCGLDGRDELELHPILAESLRRAGFGVAREQRFPADWRRRRESEGERCDLVLTPEARTLRIPDAKATLFDDEDQVDLEDAFWLEVKVVAQFTEEGANQNYASSLMSAVHHDVKKLAKDEGIRHAALLIVMFVAEPIVAEHDLSVWEHRCLDRNLPIGAPRRRSLPIMDRLGNKHCVVSVYPVGSMAVEAPA